MELVEKFDKRRNPLGKIVERYEKNDGEYEQSMNVWIINDKSEFLIQKRSESKRVFPGVWSITGGGVEVGENTVDTVVRECKEELNIEVNLDNLELVMTLKRKTDFVDVYLLKQNFRIEDITMQEEEVSDVKWVSEKQCREMIENGEFTASVSFYFDIFMQILKKFY